MVHILRQMCASLTEAHGHGLIHRDIKPENIILCERGGIPDFVKVLDFGLVQETARPDPVEASGEVVFGSPGYIAPERLVNPARTDERVDIYSLGAVAFSCSPATFPFPDPATPKSVARWCIPSPSPLGVLPGSHSCRPGRSGFRLPGQEPRGSAGQRQGDRHPVGFNGVCQRMDRRGSKTLVAEKSPADKVLDRRGAVGWEQMEQMGAGLEDLKMIGDVL